MRSSFLGVFLGNISIKIPVITVSIVLFFNRSQISLIRVREVNAPFHSNTVDMNHQRTSNIYLDSDLAELNSLNSFLAFLTGEKHKISRSLTKNSFFCCELSLRKRRVEKYT